MAFDVIRRYLVWRGYEVEFVTNITDVEDKIIAAAHEQGITPAEVAERAREQFLEAYDRLGVGRPDRLVYATEHIPQMIEAIERLIERGHAYAAEGDVYFAVRSLPTYGELSGRNVDELQSGARIDPGEHKRDPLDFALWKASKPGEPTWDSPWGPGRPGWHIECSAMAVEELGFGFDIHGGGLDLIFPHHENEVAQAEGAEGDRPFARYWFHNGMVRLKGEKMAKSVGNVVGLLDLETEHRPQAIRLFYLRSQYRQPIDFSADLVIDAEASLDRLWAFRRRWGTTDAEPDAGAVERFTVAMDDDFNTAGALGVVFDVVREGNRLLDSGEDATPFVAAYDTFMEVLGLEEPEADLDDAEVAALRDRFGVAGDDAASVVEELIARRAAARAARDFARADGIRDALDEVGVVLEDGPDGTTWHRG